MAELFTNNATSTLASGIIAADLTLTVQSGDGAKYPSPSGSDFFRAVLYKKSTGTIEIVKVTARASDVFTITRAQEGTTALILNAGDLVELRPTAAFFASLTVTDEAVQVNSFNTASADTGGVNVHVVGLTPVVTAYQVGLAFTFVPAFTNTGASTVNVDGIGAVNILRWDGSALLSGDIVANKPTEVRHDGTQFRLTNVVDSVPSRGAATIQDTKTFTGTIIQKMGADIASATALPVAVAGNIFDVTGNVTVTSFAAKGVGSKIVLQFDDVLILTHHATNLRLPGNADIETAAGDIGVFYEYSAGLWRCINYTRNAIAPGAGATKDWGTVTTNTTINLEDADLHIIEVGASITLTFAAVNAIERATIAIHNNNGYTITPAGIDNNVPTFTVGTNVQDIIGLIKSHGKITTVGLMDNVSAL